MTNRCAVEAYHRAFGKAAGRQHRAIKIDGDPLQLRTDQSIARHAADHPANLNSAVVIHLGQDAVERNDIGKAGQSKYASHQWIILIVANITQTTISQQQMKHKHHDN